MKGYFNSLPPALVCREAAACAAGSPSSQAFACTLGGRYRSASQALDRVVASRRRISAGPGRLSLIVVAEPSAMLGLSPTTRRPAAWFPAANRRSCKRPSILSTTCPDAERRVRILTIDRLRIGSELMQARRAVRAVNPRCALHQIGDGPPYLARRLGTRSAEACCTPTIPTAALDR